MADKALTSLSLPLFDHSKLTAGVTLSLFDHEIMIDTWRGLEKLRGLMTTEMNGSFQKAWTAESTVAMLLSKGHFLS